MKKNLLLFILVMTTIMVSFSACVVQRGDHHRDNRRPNGHYNRY